MEPDQIEFMHQAAEEFRERHDLPHGYVYFLDANSRPCAWSLQPEFRAFRDGVLIVHTVLPGAARILGGDSVEIVSEA